MKSLILHLQDPGDRGCDAVYLVTKPGATARSLRHEYNKCLSATKATYPEEWTLADVRALMEKAGWTFLPAEVVEGQF